MKSICICILVVFVLISCKEDQSSQSAGDQGKEISFKGTSPLPSTIELEKQRYAWQKPELVINKLGNLEDKVVADIGAGTGYFTFRLLQRAKKVIAVDIDPNMLNLIEVFRENVDSSQQTKVETRIASPDDPNLYLEEVDVVVIINTIGYIQDRQLYLSNLREKIKEGGEIMIVDFKMKQIPGNIAPDPTYRLSLLELETILVQSGYHVIESDDRSLDYQYIVLASKN